MRAVVVGLAGVCGLVSHHVCTESIALDLGQGRHTTRAVDAARLAGTWVVAVRDAVGSRALVKARTASLGAGRARTAVLLLGLVAAGVAGHEAQAGERHDGEAVGLGLGNGSNAGGTGQDGDGGEVHLVWVLATI